MPWFRVDDGFHGHPKVDMLSPAAVGIWTLCGSWSAQYLTDGLVFARTVAKFGGTDAEVQELVHSGLWLDNGDGSYQFKDWADYQPVKADVEAEREAARERMRKVRAAKKGAGDVRPNTQRTSEEVRVTPPSPALPIPSQPNPSPDAFATWYAAYPKKVGKGAAERAFKAALKKTDLETLTAGRDRYIAATRDTDPKFIANPATWLNGERWADETPGHSKPATPHRITGRMDF